MTVTDRWLACMRDGTHTPGDRWTLWRPVWVAANFNRYSRLPICDTCGVPISDSRLAIDDIPEEMAA